MEARLCSVSCPHSRRRKTPAENPAQDAERKTRDTTRKPGSSVTKRTKTTEVTQTQRGFIRIRTMTPKHTLLYPQKQEAGRAQSRPPGATMGGPVPSGPRSQTRASSGPCPASSTTLLLAENPRSSREEAGKALRLPRFQDLPKTNTSGLIPRFFNFPGYNSGGIFSLVEIIPRSGLRSDCGSFHKLPGPPRGPGFWMTRVSLACARPPQGGPIGCSPPHAPLEGSFHVRPWGSLDTPPKGVVPR